MFEVWTVQGKWAVWAHGMKCCGRFTGWCCWLEFGYTLYDCMGVYLSTELVECVQTVARQVEREHMR